MASSSLRDRTIVVTGASAGVGRASALRLAREGAHIVLIARDPNALTQVAREVEARGGRALAIPCDVADARAVFAAADQAEQTFGPIDVWINNAMVTVFSALDDLTPEEFHRVTDVTYHGYVHGTMAALRHMRRRDRGVIVQVGSALAYRGIPLQAAYCGAKHAIVGFTDSVITELLHDESDIKLTMVHLPAVNTPQFDWARAHLPRKPRPAGTIYQPEAAAEAILHAIEYPVREYWLGASTATAILGNSLMPSAGDHYLAANAVEGQMTDEPIGRDRRDNLFEPARALHRTRGSFSGQSRSGAIQMHGEAMRIGAAAAGIALATVAGFAVGALTRSRG